MDIQPIVFRHLKEWNMVEEILEKIEVSSEDNVTEDIQTELDDDGQITLNLD